jgi:hypothetical protein
MRRASAAPNSDHFMKNKLSSKLLTALLLGLILCAAFSLRACDLDRPSLWEDDYLGLDRALMEPARVFAIQKYQGPSKTTFDFQPPLFYLAAHYALALSHTAFSAKMVSVLAGTLTVLAFFLLGRTLLGREAGFYAALLCALSLYNIAGSRALKAYAFFHLFYAASFAFLFLSLRSGRLRDWVAYCVTALCMLYTSFIGTPALAGQGLAAGIFLLRAWRRAPAEDCAKRARQNILAALAAFAVIMAGFSPFLGGVFYLRDFMAEPVSFAFLRIPPDAWPGMVSGFFFHSFPANAFWWSVAALFCGLGALAFLREKKGFDLLLLVLGILVPVAATLCSRSSHPVENRHLAPLFLLAILLPACGVSLVSRMITRKIPGAQAAMGAGLCLFLSVPSLTHLDQFYRTSLSYDKELFSLLAKDKNNIGYLEFLEFQAETKGLGAAWTLSGLFKDFSYFAPSPYKRSYLVQNYLSGEKTFQPGRFDLLKKAFSLSIFNTDIYARGILNRSPLIMAPKDGRFVYAEDFDALTLFSDCSAAQNVFPDLERTVLKTTDPARPASLEYEFRIPEGGSLESLSLSLSAFLYKRNPNLRTDSKIIVSASRDGEPGQRVATIDFEDFLNEKGAYVPRDCPHFLVYFNRKCGAAQKRLDLFPNAPPRSSLRLRFDFETDVMEGNLVLDAFQLEGRLSDGGTNEDILSRVFKNVAQNACLAKWTDETELALSDCVHAFDRTDRLGCDSPEATCNASADLAKYKAAHPGAAPVYALADRDGEAGVEFYDPGLADPFIRLSAARPRARIDRGTSAPLIVKSLKVTGRLDVPSFTVDGRRVAVPVYAPDGSTLILNAGGEGRLYLNPVFTKERYDPDSFLNIYNLARNERLGEDGCLTCREDYPCFFTYSVISAFPIREVLFENHLRAFMDAAKTNGVKVLVSTGDEHFVPVEEFSSDGSGIWKYSNGQTRVLSFKSPVTALKIRVEMTGQGAQIWSTDRPIDDMRITCTLDAVFFEQFVIEHGKFDLSLDKPEGNDAGFYFSGESERFFDDLRHYR